MTQPEPEDQTRALRRLPKRPESRVVREPSRSVGTIAATDSHSQPAPSPARLYFEQLPDPFAEETPELSAKPVESAAVAETTDSFAQDPSFYFRHSTPARSADETPHVPFWEESPRRRFSEDERSVASFSKGETVVPKKDSVPDQQPERTERTLRPEQEDAGDPQPAATRLAAISKLRSTRASGQYSVARPSGDFPSTRTSGSAVTARPSVTVTAARASGASSIARTSSHLSSVRASASIPTQLTSEETLFGSDANMTGDSERADGESALPDRSVPTRDGQSAGRSNKGKAVAGMTFASLALIAYAFEVGGLESVADAAAGRLTTGGSVLSSLLPWLLVLPALLLFGLIVWLLSGIIGLRQTNKTPKRSRPGTLPKSPLNEFKAEALRHGVDNRTAYRGWRLIEAALGGDRAVTIDSTLVDDLGLAQREIRAIHLQLLTDLSRVRDPAMKLPPAETVLELLRAVDGAPVLRPASASGEVSLPGDPGQGKRK